MRGRCWISSTVAGIRPVAIDVYAALDMTLPGIVSERSVAVGGNWLPVPDPRTLTAGIGVEPQPPGGAVTQAGQGPQDSA